MSPELFNAHTRPPLLFVTHLPSASSFYASIIQPLGLQFLSSPPVQTIPPTLAVLNYGYITQGPAGLKHVVVFSVTQGRPGAIRPAKIGLSACSEAAVKEFWKKSALLNKGVRTPGKLDYLVENEEEGGAEIVVSRTRDFDGNMLEAVYRRGDRGYGGGTGYAHRREAIEMSPAQKEARRVLEWQEQVARSIGDSGSTGGAASVISSSDIVDGYRPVARRADSYPVQGSERQVPMRLVRRETTTTEHYRRPDERESGARGMSGKAVIGTLLGAAAGAAFAYAMVRSESPERERRPPAAMRRASYGNQTHYTQVAQSPREVAPPRSYVSARGEGGPRYEDVRYLDAAPRVHQIENESYVSECPNRSVRGASNARSRSEVGSRYDRPLTIQPARSQSRARSPSRSHASQRSNYRTRKEGSPSRSRRTESHVSARSHHSHHSHSTAKQSPPPATSTIKIRSVPSEGGTRTMHSGYERDVERARHVPLPVSIVGGTGYAASVAPSDSVSSIGFKRERERLRDRMSVRDSRGGW